MQCRIWFLADRGGFACAADDSKLRKAVDLLLGMVRDDGEPLGINPTTLVVGRKIGLPPKIIDAMLIDGGDSNIYYKDVDIVNSPFITTPA